MFQQPAAPKKSMRKEAKVVLGLSLVNFLALCVISYLLYGVSERWWVGTVLTYAPRSPFVAPAMALIVASIFWHRESIVINLVSLVVAIVPIMGLCVPLAAWGKSAPAASHQKPLKIISCNVQEFRPDFAAVLEEISVLNPDVIALQEALMRHPLLDRHFPDWHFVREGNFCVASRFPVRLKTTCEVTQFEGRMAGAVVQIETPDGRINLANVHQMTARRGLTELSRRTLVDGDGTRELETFESERYLEAIELRAAIDRVVTGETLVVCGDFNTPVSSSLFQRHWGDLQSSFDVAGFGFGYTSPCKGNRFWPNNLPWARIDHILCSSDWTVQRCQIGRTDGSDHRLIFAALSKSSPQKVAQVENQSNP